MRHLFVILSAICLAVGVLPTCQPEHDLQLKYDQKLDGARAALAGISEALGKYKQGTGRYPSNDEGLAAIIPPPGARPEPTTAEHPG